MVSNKIILTIVTFLLINIPLNTSYADSDIAALGNLRGIYVNLQINDKTPQGIPKQRIDKKRLLKYIEGSLINTIGKEKGIRLFNAIDPHLNVKVIIEGQELHAAAGPKKYKYYVTVKASLERNASEWYREHTVLWTENTKVINQYKESVRKAIVKLNKAKKASYRLDQKSNHTAKINRATQELALEKGTLALWTKMLDIEKKAEEKLGLIAHELRNDYIRAKRKEVEYKKNEQEVEELSKQLGYEEETISLQQKEERYVESKIFSRANVLYEIGNIIKLRNSSDTVFALYKDESLSNITNLFTNGTKATIMDYKALPDKPFVYKIQMFLKDGSEYVGWVSESVINK